MTEQTILLVDDDDVLRSALEQSFELAGLAVIAERDPVAALARIDAGFDGAVVSDIRMPRMDGLELFRRISTIDHEIPVLLMTGHGDVAMAVAALKTGAFDFIPKPFATDHLVASTRRALEMRRLVLDNRRLRSAVEDSIGSDLLIGDTPVMVRLRDTMRQIAQADIDVLIEGETGTGKELVAILLHRWSSRRSRPFVAVNCAALPEAVAEIELFGHEADAIPQSRLARTGRIEASHRGTLFLDEIESTLPPFQAKLLRVLEEREIMPIGAAQPRALDLRVIAAAKPGLEQAVATGRFRADLLFRLDAVRLRVPPLRERRDDVPLLFGHLLRQAADRFGRDVPTVDTATHAHLVHHDWPGNVRELDNLAKRLVLGIGDAAPEEGSDVPLPARVDRFEEATIRATLQQVNGDVRSALAALGIPRKTFYDKLKRHDIDVEAYRPMRG
ncbi:sigma-54-dependent transcriptional regulator [Sphingomonas sp. R86520]|uniref:sigma-54-dependent transcriptional regulator n=1 Tax=Sphingomonas sp. R86520 TaxID=3093859 RepID=UPI0036D29665